MKYILSKIVGTLFITMLISSCCKSSLIDSFYFSDSDGLVVPYTGTETLRFIDDSSNVIIYNNGIRFTAQEEVSACNGGCCDYYFVESFDNTYFESEYMKSNIQVTITNNFDSNTGAMDIPTISFVWDYYEIGPYVTSTWFENLPVVLMKQAAIDRGMFQDSLMLREIQYYDIYSFKGECSYQDRLFADSLFYSTSEGVVGIKFSDGNLWTKIQPVNK